MRKLLYKILGLKKYLRLISFIYIRLIKCGYAKKKYEELYFLRKIIKEGFTCIDIGANLGYYSYFLTKYAGNGGKIYAVEPIPLYGEILQKNVKADNFRLFPYALGAENKSVEMGLPNINGRLHHGMTKIISEKNDNNNYEKKFQVEMKIPDELFDEIEKIDFIKIDIEGYESIAFENMKTILRKHKPLIQSELSGIENKRKAIEILSELGYKTKILKGNKLIDIATQHISDYNNDFYFVI